jgi:hypothetical protein
MARMSSRSKRVPYVVFYATRTALVWATDEPHAYDVFINTAFPESDRGRLVPPDRTEVHIRRLASTDRGWIEEFDGPAAREFLTALEQVT